MKCDAHNTWLDTKIAALWDAKHAADAALWVAQKALSAAKAIVGAAGDVDVDLDPEVLAWEADNAALQVYGDSAMAGLKAAKFVADGVLDLASFVHDEGGEVQDPIGDKLRRWGLGPRLLRHGRDRQKRTANGGCTSKPRAWVLLYMVYLESTHIQVPS